MKEFITYPESKWKTRSEANKIDDVLETIVANAKKYKQFFETSQPHQSFLFNLRKVS